jgi:pimeloyl-CoA synthetase
MTTKLSEEARLESAVDFFLNVYDELCEKDDPKGELGYMMGDDALAGRVLDAFWAQPGEEQVKLIRFDPSDPRDERLRRWLSRVMEV